MKASLQIIASGQADDWISGLSWHPSSSKLLISPTSGKTMEFSLDSKSINTFPGFGLNNGIAVYAPDDSVCLPGGDGKIRFAKDGNEPKEITLGKGWITALRWNKSSQHFAAASGKALKIFNAAKQEESVFSDHKSSVCDFCWNPSRPSQIAAVGDGGATMWQVGKAEPFARFDWGGASVLVDWSYDGRWLVTGDLTPSVHLFDFNRNHPLHIQGYDTKVRALSFDCHSEKLASAGGATVVVWDCTGEKGPEDTTPLQLYGHDGDCQALRFHPQSSVLATGGQDCRFIVYDLAESSSIQFAAELPSPVSCMEWAPDGKKIAIGCEGGYYHILQTSFS